MVKPGTVIAAVGVASALVVLVVGTLKAMGRKPRPEGNRMAGRQTFFSFHYQRDISRVNVVRNAGVVDAQAAAGWTDASLWEKTKKQGDAAIKKLIDAGLAGTSVTVVLIGAKTSTRDYVNYEIQQSINRGNGLLGVRIHSIKDFNQNTDAQGATPKLLADKGYPVYDWDRNQFGKWVEKAAVAAGKSCLAHGSYGCRWCS